MYGDNENAKVPPPTDPVEPNGFQLTEHREHLADIRAKMQKVADEINAHLRATAERQQYKRGKK